MRVITLVALLFISFSSVAQQNVGIGTTTPDSSAILELKSNNKGLLLPRLTTAQRDSIVNPTNGLLLYNTSNLRLELCTPSITGTSTSIGNNSTPTSSIPARWNTSTANTAAQSFLTPFNAVSISEITVVLTSSGNNSGNMTLKLFDGNGVFGNPIISQNLYNYVSNSSLTFTFPTPIFVAANSMYTFLIGPDGSLGGGVSIATTNNNAYSDGTAFANQTPVNNNDLLFTVRCNKSSSLEWTPLTSSSGSSSSSTGNGIQNFSSLTVDNSNNRIGIGVISPLSRLSVSSINSGTGYANWVAADFGAVNGARVVTGLLNGKPAIGGHTAGFGGWADFIINGGGGNVGIGTETPGYTLEVNGRVAGVHPFLSLSDKRFKTNVQPLQNPLQKILALKGISFYWDLNNAGDKKFDTLNHIGFLAQDVEKILPQVVNTANDPNKTKTVAYSDIVPVLVEAIKELQGQIEALKKQLKKLKNK